MFGLTVALRLTGLTNLLYEVAFASTNASSLWPVYSKGLPLEPTAGESAVHSYHLLRYGKRVAISTGLLLHQAPLRKELRFPGAFEIREDLVVALVRPSALDQAALPAGEILARSRRAPSQTPLAVSKPAPDHGPDS